MNQPQRMRNPFLLIALTCSLTFDSIQAESPDDKLTDILESALAEDPGVFSNDLDVSAKDGIVTLSGESESFLQKRRAAEVVKLRQGVKALINQIAVSPGPKSDSTIKEQVEAALLYNDEITTQEINVAVSDGVVTLSGTAFGWAHYNKAEREAGGVSGVTEVINNLKVDWDAERSDEEIRNHIEKLYRFDIRLPGESIRVAVNNGLVTLTGKVRTLNEKERAYHHAWVTAVKDVIDDDLAIAASGSIRTEEPSFDDEEIRQFLTEALLADPRVDPSCLIVIADSGSVVLRGRVRSLLTKESAEQTARNTAGVSDVRNHLKVRAGTERDDASIKASVIAALQRHPDIEAYDINVRVNDGRVILSGEVDSTYDLRQARSVAARAAGVKEVTNKLRAD